MYSIQNSTESQYSTAEHNDEQTSSLNIIAFADKRWTMVGEIWNAKQSTVLCNHKNCKLYECHTTKYVLWTPALQPMLLVIYMPHQYRPKWHNVLQDTDAYGNSDVTFIAFVPNTI